MFQSFARIRAGARVSFLLEKKSEKLKKSIDSDTDLIFSLFIAGALPA
jgi:hypothetical protein